MKHYLLKLIATHWQHYTSINAIKRIRDNELRISFKPTHERNREESSAYDIDLSRSKSQIYINDDMDSGLKSYQAPFDVALKHRFTKAQIVAIRVAHKDRILNITVLKKQAYKLVQSILQLEFTGRHTNAIIMNEKGIIQEALRHIDDYASIRSIKVGYPLPDIPPLKSPIVEQEKSVTDIRAYLKALYQEHTAQRVASIKTQALIKMDRKIKALRQIRQTLPSLEDMQQQIKISQMNAHLILTHAGEINLYKPLIKIESINITVPDHLIGTKVYRLSDYYFDKVKKLKRKIDNIHLQQENLQAKLDFLYRQKTLIAQSDRLADICFLDTPSMKRSDKKSFCESFFFQGYKILIGRNSSENAKILQHSRKDDIWLHLKNMSSAHTLIQTGKQQCPMSVIEKAAKLCVDFSTTQRGRYSVDYTTRKNVKIKQGAQVEYINYKSLVVNV